MMEMQITTNPIYRINYNTNRLVYAVLYIISDIYEDTIGDFPPIIILTKIRILFILSKKIIKNEDFFCILSVCYSPRREQPAQQPGQTIEIL